MFGSETRIWNFLSAKNVKILSFQNIFHSKLERISYRMKILISDYLYSLPFHLRSMWPLSNDTSSMNNILCQSMRSSAWIMDTRNWLILCITNFTLECSSMCCFVFHFIHSFKYPNLLYKYFLCDSCHLGQYQGLNWGQSDLKAWVSTNLNKEPASISGTVTAVYILWYLVQKRRHQHTLNSGLHLHIPFCTPPMSSWYYSWPIISCWYDSLTGIHK